jgi:hypothetical protein
MAKAETMRPIRRGRWGCWGSEVCPGPIGYQDGNQMADVADLPNAIPRAL